MVRATFIKKLKATAGRGWTIHRDGCVRVRMKKMSTCPICAVSGAGGLEGDEQAEILKLDSALASHIMTAADMTLQELKEETWTPEFSIRKSMLKALGLQQHKYA